MSVLLFRTKREPALPSFETIDALMDSLQAAGLTASLPQVIAAARPVILFRRHQVPDAALPHDASKLGGTPMLPAGFMWPHREVDAESPRLAAACRRQGIRLAEFMAKLHAERLSCPLQPGGRNAEAPKVDTMVAEYDLIADTLLRPFPLAFVAQLDLSSLSAQAGFDSALPRTGTLSFFCDARPYGSAETVAVWTDKPGIPTEPPTDLLTYYAAHCANNSEPWHELTQAEALLPFSAIDLPPCWPETAAVEEWLANLVSYALPAIAADGDQDVFGERLCGYHHGVQEDLEQGPTQEIAPRHLFSWAGEYYSGTRLIPIDELGDGQASLLIREEDLANRRFQEAKTFVQRT